MQTPRDCTADEAPIGGTFPANERLLFGDVFFQEKCERRIEHFIEGGNVTVLFVSHSMDQVERICSRAVWIEKGDLRMDDPVDEVCKAYRAQFA